jgi:hypothetical protein
MSNVLVNSLSEQHEVDELLDMKIPHYRQAYSDRTAWLMACLSDLAYVKFNPLVKSTSKQHFVEKVVSLIGDTKSASLNTLLLTLDYDPEEEEQKLKNSSGLLNLKLVKTFDNNGTQAIILENNSHVFLAFRGTEATSIKDVKADANGVMVECETGGKVHSGFNQAFNQTAVEIQSYLNQEPCVNKPLFITGHSLGGALATIATKQLKHKAGIAACYTYGSPRVGDANWAYNIKAPVYRLVNAADPVTVLPPGKEFIELSAWLVGLLPYVGDAIKKVLLSKFNGYMHIGDMKYLTNSPVNNYKNVRLLYSVSFVFRLKAFLVGKTSFSKIPSDHSISIYRKKLMVIASKRNK